MLLRRKLWRMFYCHFQKVFRIVVKVSAHRRVNQKKMNLLLEHLEDNDDVQNVYHNWENAD